jgi:hypothetical protein
MTKRATKRRPTPQEFDEAAPVGTLVRYYRVLPADEDAWEMSCVRSGAWELGGRTVVMIEGRSGGVDVGHLALINPKKRIGGIAGIITTAN